jgi:UDP-2,3-diacylglucosamine pyrophosphatase LpxH
MRFLILSDIHLGDPRFTQDLKLIHLLQKEKYDILILNGDIWDSWQEKNVDKIFDEHPVLITFLRELSNKKCLIWLQGNHDPDMKNALKFLPDVIFLDQLDLDIPSGGRCLVAHGHQTEYFYRMVPRYFVKINTWIYRHTHGKVDLERGVRMLFGLYPYLVKRRILAFMKKMKDQYRYFICGHTHIKAIYHIDGLTTFDTGEWFDDSPYIIVDKEIEFKQWKE